MQRSKHILAGVGVAAIATALFSFSGEKAEKKKEDDHKKKKYHVIHQKDGMMQEFDTIIPMNSDYSVEDFLASKGIDNEDVKIVKIPSMANMAFMSKDGKDAKVFMHHMDEEMIITDDDGKHEEVKIIREKNDDGEVTVRKFVNGEEVEVSEEDLEHHQNHWHHRGGGEHHAIIIEDGDGDLEWTPKEGEHNVELKVEMDDEGNMKVQKFVNGEEVEVTEEEMEKIQQGNGNVFIIHEDHMGDIDIDMDSMMNHMEMKVEILDEEDMKDGENRVIIREFHSDGESHEHHDHKMRKEMRMKHHIAVDGEDSEDFTLVLVHENYGETMEAHMQMRIISDDDDEEVNERGVALNDPISVYPNPNDGTFTIAFDQKNEVKTSIRVVDAQGKVVFKEKLGDFSGSYKKELDLKKHGAGVFIVTIQQGDETSSRKVIVE